MKEYKYIRKKSHKREHPKERVFDQAKYDQVNNYKGICHECTRRDILQLTRDQTSKDFQSL